MVESQPIPQPVSKQPASGSSAFKKPKKFDRNLIVIGAGAAGLVASRIAAGVKASVTLIEGYRMGGDSLNTGGVPSQSLIRSARLMADIRRGREFGLKPQRPEFEFAEVMERVQRTVRTIAPRDSVQRYTELGVECVQGYAKLVSPWEVEVNGQRLSARSIVIATGARPSVLPIPGLAKTGYFTSDTVWDLREKPRRLVVLGGGPVGCELGQAMARLGVNVTQIEMLPSLLPREDEDVSAAVTKKFLREGIRVLTGHKATAADLYAKDKVVICEHEGKTVRVPCDEILVAVGRTANTDGLGLEELGIELSPSRTVKVDAYLRVPNFPHILACGDVAGPYQFTQVASHQAWYAAMNGLFRGFKQFRADYSVIPWATFTDPEVARVGLSEAEAKAQNVSYEVVRYEIDDLDRAMVDEEAHGFVKVLTVPGKDRILGVTIVGHHAGDLIAEYVLAMKHGLGLSKILDTLHIYPTFSEANRDAAGEWKKAHKPEWLLKWAERFHRWRL
ncbi:MAG TPA: FAD-dependent oxidoreductase [Dongiaceae bacterium]|nr:FAD-dependent oxidoreductase [Dongiaceae bacterium]